MPNGLWRLRTERRNGRALTITARCLTIWEMSRRRNEPGHSGCFYIYYNYIDTSGINNPAGATNDVDPHPPCLPCLLLSSSFSLLSSSSTPQSLLPPPQCPGSKSPSPSPPAPAAPTSSPTMLSPNSPSSAITRSACSISSSNTLAAPSR